MIHYLSCSHLHLQEYERYQAEEEAAAAKELEELDALAGPVDAAMVSIGEKPAAHTQAASDVVLAHHPMVSESMLQGKGVHDLVSRLLAQHKEESAEMLSMLERLDQRVTTLQDIIAGSQQRREGAPQTPAAVAGVPAQAAPDASAAAATVVPPAPAAGFSDV